MSLISDRMTGSEGEAERPRAAGVSASSNFRFIPSELAVKCKTLIESYHEMHGYGPLPDMLWHSNARDVIECHRELMDIFQSASRSRCAKRANSSMLLVATVIVAVEVLARDFAGWGKRFPAARREAEGVLIDFTRRTRGWFMDQYLYPTLSLHRERANTLAPSVGGSALVQA
jgi:hypothetical protein